MRLDKYLSGAGAGTRRQVKAYIRKGIVTVNGTIIRDIGHPVNEYSDRVFLDQEEIRYRRFIYLLLNKPSGYVSATVDDRYPPVTELVGEYAYADLFPVGRLDMDTTGVLLLTNNGLLTHRLLSPKYHVDKTYAVETDLPIQEEMISAFREGIFLHGEKTLPGELTIQDPHHATLTIHQGRYHQVKEMFAAFGLTVVRLDRISFAFLTYEGLKQGEYRELTPQEINRLIELGETNVQKAL